MKAFSFNRFLNVARWDLSVNSKFYTRSSILMVAIFCMPVVLYYLYSMLNRNYFLSGDVSDNIDAFIVVFGLISLAYMVISSGYMFHNLITKQGRINEFTLPATNLERFLWHFVVIVIGVQVVSYLGVVVADLLHALFRLMIPEAEIKSLTLSSFDYSLSNLEAFGAHSFGIMLLCFLMFACYIRSFCLVNAWKYRYNIPLTFLIYFVLQTVLPLLLLFIGKLFINLERLESFVEWIENTDSSTVLVFLNSFFALLYVGIWLLTYRLYTRAQLTTRRNP